MKLQLRVILQQKGSEILEGVLWLALLSLLGIAFLKIFGHFKSLHHDQLKFFIQQQEKFHAPSRR